MSLKVATFNANSLRSRLPIVTAWLDKHKPDVLSVQETKVQDPDFPLEAFTDTGYHIVFKGEKKYNGVAVFSLEEACDVSFGMDSAPQDPARFIHARINDITYINTYIPQGRDRDTDQFRYKLKWYERLEAYFKKHLNPSDPILWMGDFNVALDERDVHDPKRIWGHVCYCQEVQDAMQRLMKWGYTDTFRLHCQEPEHYTFWDYRVPNGFKRNIGWRLDYIMATRSLADKCTTCWVDKEPRGLEKPSDHTFLIAEFDL